MADGRSVWQGGELVAGGLLVTRGCVGGIDASAQALAQRGKLGGRRATVDLGMEVGHLPDHTEETPGPGLGVAEQRHPIDPLEDDSRAAIDLDPLVSRGRGEPRRVDRACYREFMVGPLACDPAVEELP